MRTTAGEVQEAKAKGKEDECKGERRRGKMQVENNNFKAETDSEVSSEESGTSGDKRRKTRNDVREHQQDIEAPSPSGAEAEVGKSARRRAAWLCMAHHHSPVKG